MADIDHLRDQLVRDILRESLPADGRVLEISCGEGRVLEQLRNDGFTVRGTNYTAYPDAPASVPIDNGVDLLAGLPYENASYDCVMFLDVIEHLRDHETAIRHVARVLKPRGLLIIASPNICNISSRLHFLTTGFFKVRRSFVGFDLPIDRSFAFHNHPPHLPVLLYQMHSLGVPMTRLESVGWKLKSVLFYLLLLPIVGLCTFYRTARQEKFLAGTQAGRLLRRTLTSTSCLIGEAMVIVGQRTGSSDAPLSTPKETHMPAWYHEDASDQKPVNT